MSYNITPCDNCGSYTVDFVQNLQNQVDKKIASQINRKRASEKNDLGLCFDHKSYWDLNIYNEILTQIQACNSCFSDYNIEDLVSLVKNELV